VKVLHLAGVCVLVKAGQMTTFETETSPPAPPRRLADFWRTSKETIGTLGATPGLTSYWVDQWLPCRRSRCPCSPIAVTHNGAPPDAGGGCKPSANVVCPLGLRGRSLHKARLSLALGGNSQSGFLFLTTLYARTGRVPLPLRKCCRNCDAPICCAFVRAVGA